MYLCVSIILLQLNLLTKAHAARYILRCLSTIYLGEKKVGRYTESMYSFEKEESTSKWD